MGSFNQRQKLKRTGTVSTSRLNPWGDCLGHTVLRKVLKLSVGPGRTNMASPQPSVTSLSQKPSRSPALTLPDLTSLAPEVHAASLGVGEGTATLDVRASSNGLLPSSLVQGVTALCSAHRGLGHLSSVFLPETPLFWPSEQLGRVLTHPWPPCWPSTSFLHLVEFTGVEVKGKGRAWLATLQHGWVSQPHTEALPVA